MNSKNKTLKMLKIWREWELTINDIGLDSAVLSAMDEYAKSQIKILNIPFVNTRNYRLVMLHDYNVVHLEWNRPHKYLRCFIGGLIWRFMPDLTIKHRRFMIVDYGC